MWHYDFWGCTHYPGQIQCTLFCGYLVHERKAERARLIHVCDTHQNSPHTGLRQLCLLVILVQLCTHVFRLKVAYVALILLKHAWLVFAIGLSLYRKCLLLAFPFSPLSPCNDVCMNLHRLIASSSTCACVQGVFGHPYYSSVAALHRYTELNSWMPCKFYRIHSIPRLLLHCQQCWSIAAHTPCRQKPIPRSRVPKPIATYFEAKEPVEWT